jgi:SET domain-containing protein
MEGRFIMLKTIKDIKKDEELTAKYWLYSLNGK